MPACDAPPRFSSKNARCFLPGAPSVIDQATMRPSAGATKTPRLAPTRNWYAVVREMTSHGLVGQLATGGVPMAPTSMMRADATPGSASAATKAVQISLENVLCMPAFNTSRRSRLLSGRRPRPPPPSAIRPSGR